MEASIQVRVCPTNEPTRDVWRDYRRIPTIGETVRVDDELYVVVEVEWDEYGQPLVIAHSPDRARARVVRGQ